MKTKIAAVGFAAALSLASFSGAVADKPDQPGKSHLKEYVCHATGSESNQYVIIHINDSAVDSPHLADPGHNKPSGNPDGVLVGTGETAACDFPE